MVGERDRPEIEITGEMIEAAANAVLDMNIEGVFTLSFARQIALAALVASYSAYRDHGSSR
jgi:hypothetical protein